MGSGYYWSDVFEEYTTADAGIECGTVPHNGRGCYIGCTCKSGWNGKKSYSAASSGLNQTGTVNVTSASTATPNPLSIANILETAPSATSAVGNYSTTVSAASAVVDLPSASGTKSGVSAMAAGDSCSVSFSDGRYGTTCSKSGNFACPSGYGYSKDSCKKNQETKYQVCSVDSTQTNSTLCYSAGTSLTCADENSAYVSACPSGQSGTKVTTSCGNTCYKDCKNDEYYDVTFKFLVGTSCTGTSTAADLHIYLRIRSQADDHLVYELSETVHCSHGDTSDAHLYARDMPAGTYDLEQFSISGGAGELHIDNVSGSVRAPLEGESFEVDSKFSNPGYYYVYSLTWL